MVRVILEVTPGRVPFYEGSGSQMIRSVRHLAMNFFFE